jgi:hypothetical protein
MRNLSPEVISAIQSRSVSMRYFFKGDFTFGSFRLWTGNGDKTFLSESYFGDGSLLAVSNLREVLGAQAYGISVTIAGISFDKLSIVLNETASNQSGIVYLVWVDSNENIIGYYQAFKGDLDDIKVKESPTNATLIISYESKLIKVKKKRELRWSNSFQQLKYPGDKGFQYLEQIKNKRIYWGAPDTSRG